MKRGDILLIKFKWDFPVGWIIRRFTHCKWNHVAWAINNKELIELNATGKQKVFLSHYLNQWFFKCKMIRIKELPNCKLNKAIGRAETTQFNYPYTSFIINFILIKLKILGESPRLSCSSFIAYYLSQVSFYFNGKNIHFITPRDIEKSRKVIDVSHELRCSNSSI